MTPDDNSREWSNVFTRISQAIKQIASQSNISHDDTLQLYALQMQSTEGPCIGQGKPSFFDIQGKYKQEPTDLVREHHHAKKCRHGKIYPPGIEYTAATSNASEGT